MITPLAKIWRSACVFRWLVIPCLVLTLTGCGSKKDPLELAILEAAKRHPGYAPKWEKTIREQANYFLLEIKTNRTDPEKNALAKKAVAEGCQDPLVRYITWRRRILGADINNQTMVREGLAVVNELHAMQAPAFIRVFVESRVYSAWRKAYPADDDPNTLKLYQRHWQDVFGALQDPGTPEWLANRLAMDLARMWTLTHGIGKEAVARLEATLTLRFGDCATVHQLRAENTLIRLRHILYKENLAQKLAQWEVTSDDMELAWKELLMAWKLDPTNIHIATGLVELCRYHQRPKADMEHWFQQGLQTGMDGSMLCLQKSTFLSPDWGGLIEEQLAFGRECTARPEYGYEAGTIITRAHAGYAIDLGLREEYFSRPEVWKDLSAGYEAYFRQCPHMLNMRLRYAQRAWQTEHWEVLGQQLKLLDPSTLDLERIGGAGVLEQMIVDAQAHGQLPSTPDTIKSY